MTLFQVTGTMLYLDCSEVGPEVNLNFQQKLSIVLYVTLV